MDIVDDKIRLIQKYKEILEEYLNLIQQICPNSTLHLDPIVNYKSFKNYKIFYQNLDKTCESDIFLKLEDLIYSIPIKCNYNKKAMINLAATTVRVNTKGKIKCVSDITVPPFNRDSYDFLYLHEGIHGVFYQSRLKKDYILSDDIEVLPYFYELYALDKLKGNYSKKTQNYVLGSYIITVYYYIMYIFYELHNSVINQSHSELTKSNNEEKLKYIKSRKMNLYYAFQEVLGIIKSISLFISYYNNQIGIEDINKALIDRDKLIGEELDYSKYSLDNEATFKNYKDFLKKNKQVLKKVVNYDTIK